MRISHPDRLSEKSLFVSVDEIYPGAVSFLVHREMEQIAHSIIATIPVVMLAWYGNEAIDWFRDDVEELMDGYYWDEDTCMVKCRHDQDLDNESYQDFEDDDISLHDEYTEKKVMVENFCIEMLDSTSGVQQYHDSGRTVASFRSACGTPQAKGGIKLSNRASTLATMETLGNSSDDSLTDQFASLATPRESPKPGHSGLRPSPTNKGEVREKGRSTRRRRQGKGEVTEVSPRTMPSSSGKSGRDKEHSTGPNLTQYTNIYSDLDTLNSNQHIPSPMIQVNNSEPTPSTITADSTSAMQQFVTNNPKAFQQFLENNPSIIDQYIRKGPQTVQEAPTEVTLPSTVTPSTDKNGRATQNGGDKP